jgi:RHS repeat-associated protein
MITDINANVVQQVLYAPFGEVITEHNAYWHNGLLPDYMFNAKELDEESGMYYYEARYYAPPSFISRDPLFEKYPFMSPYAYCNNNPVIYIDPTGMAATPPERNAAVKYMRNMAGTPYSKLDCSAAASNAVVSAGVSNPKSGKGVDGWKNGVALIVGNSRQVDKTEIRVGDMATFKSGRSDHKGKDGEFDHIGVISKINKDDGGNIISFDFLHATSSKGIVEQTYDMEKGMSGFELKNFYQWDTPDDNGANDYPSFQNASFSVRPDPTFIDKLKDSKIPILKTVGGILDAIAN